jgi:3-phenylpropionate/trans-cinnamate dioxygenase ferredoxin subunit
MSWYKIARDIKDLSFNSNNLVEITVENKVVCIAKQSDQSIRAFAATCPHAGARLVEGYLDALGNMVCPLHHYKFEMSKGRNCSGEGYILRIYPLEWREDGIFIQFLD